MRKILSAGLLAALLAACRDDATLPPPVGSVVLPAIGVGVSGAASITRGSTAQVTVTVARLAGFTGAIDLSAEGLPAGVTAAFAPATVPAASTTSVLTLSASTTATLGTAIAGVRTRATGVTDATGELIIGVNR